jgi:hypothetical protein
MKPGHSVVPSLSPDAHPDGSCLGRHPEEKGQEKEAVPTAPAGQEEPPVNPAEPMNPA